ncbi:acyltransferase family protein [Nostoc sp. FACHB-87]|uniref:acyltransferase family protein n=1 Tax=Nostocaceae TaxID=1162 RepID=UPI0016889FC7|nr:MULTISPECIES: acyltransferase family protein [Nostocaceae]MBD2453315.1 acyltransferase family protein [Nostoc sp. FACHB-87]MBD2475439.1 acyltransferase family protein [Anabaena sp. FACHB-83]
MIGEKPTNQPLPNPKSKIQNSIIHTCQPNQPQVNRKTITLNIFMIAKPMYQRINWIDCWKGIGIASVVVGHVIEGGLSEYLYWFHMPLFFFISGFLYKDKYDYKTYLHNKVSSLLVPYFSFLLLYSGLQVFSYVVKAIRSGNILPWNEQFSFIVAYIYNQIYGGALLDNWFGVFWFVTCLFLTQQIYNLIYKKFGHYNILMISIMLVSYGLAMADFWFLTNTGYFWNINVVCMALPFYWLGHLYAQHRLENKRWLVLLSGIIFGTAIALHQLGIQPNSFAMKGGYYGIVFYSPLVALAGIILTQNLANILSKNKHLFSLMSVLGASSMMIMYVHQPVQLTMREIPILSNVLLRIITALIVSYIGYKVVLRFKILSRCFLGISS